MELLQQYKILNRRATEGSLTLKEFKREYLNDWSSMHDADSWNLREDRRQLKEIEDAVGPSGRATLKTIETVPALSRCIDITVKNITRKRQEAPRYVTYGMGSPEPMSFSRGTEVEIEAEFLISFHADFTQILEEFRDRPLEIDIGDPRIRLNLGRLWIDYAEANQDFDIVRVTLHLRGVS